jgi:DNA-binding SARP family transcriptional activator/DNA-binding CsgD family transcriptional regulator
LDGQTDTVVRLCGRMTVEIGGRRLERELPSRQGRALFAYLALHRNRVVPRAELIDALWPERDVAAPDALLSSVLSRLRRVLPPGSLEGRGQLTLRLGRDPWVDVEVATRAPGDAEAALEAGRAPEALSAVRAGLEIAALQLLPDVDRAWVDERRQRLTALLPPLHELEARAGLAAGGTELMAAEAAARAAVECAPFRESAHAVLIEVLAARGNVAEALRVYDRVRVRLRDELGTIPSPRLRTLNDRLLREEGGAPLAEPAQRPELVGRERECGWIAELLAAARAGRSRALVLSGEPGVGKSALCAWAVARAGDMRVISARGVESELDLPFAGLSELCAAELGGLALLPEPQARALEAALARHDAPPGDRFAIGAALLSLLALAAEHEPLLVVVDDAQWLDASSNGALLFAGRRLRGEGIALLFATRPGTRFDAERAGVPCEAVRGLAPPAAHALLHHAHGRMPLEVARLLTERTGGNPLALLEVPTILTGAQLAGKQPIDEPLPVGPTMVRALLGRVSGLPEEARRALLVAAASGAERVQPVVDALNVLGLDDTVLDEAERTGVLAVAGERFEFRHPLLRSALYHGAPGPARRKAHAALARVMRGEAQAWHLAHATIGEDEAVAAALERVGLEARRRGAPAAAAAALERAGRLSGPGDGRIRRLTEAARDAHIAGRPAGALRLLDDALAGSPGPVQRADIQHVRGRVLVLQGQIDTAYRLLVDEAARIRDIDPDRTATMLAEACLDRFLSADVATAIETARDASRVAERAGPGVQAFAGVMLAAALVLNGQRSEAGALLDHHLPLLRLADPLSEAGELVSAAAQCYFWLERHDVASELLTGLTASARKASAPAALLLPLACSAELDLRVGRWSIAAAQLHEAAGLGAEMEQSVFAAYPPECLARLAGATGDEQSCRDHAAHAITLIDSHRNELGRLYVLSALGLLELSLGRMEAAIGHLELARDLADRHGLDEPNIVHWQADLVEAYARAGRGDAAREALAAFERRAERTGGRWALGTAARCRGLIAENGDHDACFAAALVHLDEVAAPFEIARTHLCHGERLRRGGRRTEARRALGRALDGFDRLGAKPWAARAQMELRATGATPRRRREGSDPDQLTPHELQVALIVARGASNREAAAALFLSPKTIEFHLAHIYRKLGVRTRTELAGVAARRGWLDDSPGASEAKR